MLKNFYIKKATTYDTQIIFNFIKELAIYEKALNNLIATADDIKKNLFDNKGTTEAIICYINDKPVAFAVYFLNFSTWIGKNGIFLEDVYVMPECRKLGIGKEIFKYLTKLAIKKKINRIDWEVLAWNKDAINFYNSIGAKAKKNWLSYRLEGEAILKLSNS